MMTDAEQERTRESRLSDNDLNNNNNNNILARDENKDQSNNNNNHNHMDSDDEGETLDYEHVSIISPATESAATSSAEPKKSDRYCHKCDFTDEELSSEWFTFPKSSDQIFVEKEISQVMNKDLQQKYVDNANLEPFAKECLHLFGGEWTIVKRSYGSFQKDRSLQTTRDENVQKKHLLSFLDPEFSPIPDREITHPNTLVTHEIRFSIKCLTFRFDVGVFEPFFCSFQLYDLRLKKFLSERFYFHLNSASVVRFVTDAETRDELLAAAARQQRAIFTLTDAPHSDIYMILWVEKVLQRQPLEDVIKPYLDPDAKIDFDKLTEQAREESVMKFRQPFVWSYAPLFIEPHEGVPSHWQEVAKVTQKTMLKEGPLTFNHFFSTGGATKQLDIAEVISSADKNTSSMLKKHREVAGSCVIEVSKFDEVRFMKEINGGDVDDEELFNPNSTTPRSAEFEKGDAQGPSPRSQVAPPGQVATEKEYLKYQVQEFMTSIPKYPYLTFVHNLYIYPEMVDFTKANIEAAGAQTGAKIKPRNILIRISFRENDNEVPYIIKSFSKTLSNHAFSCVTILNKVPQFYDEVKIVLPLPIQPSHHIMFEFFHVEIESKKKGKAKISLFNKKPMSPVSQNSEAGGSSPTAAGSDDFELVPLGYSILPVSQLSAPHEGTHVLTIFREIVPGYLQNLNSLKAFDKKRNSFRVRSKIVSTISPQQQLISRFFSDCAPMLDVSSLKTSGKKEVEESLKSALRSMAMLKKVQFSELIPHLPLIMDVLFSIMCHAPDLVGSLLLAGEDDCSGGAPNWLALAAQFGGGSSLEDLTSLGISVSSLSGTDSPLGSSRGSGEAISSSYPMTSLEANRKSMDMRGRRQSVKLTEGNAVTHNPNRDSARKTSVVAPGSPQSTQEKRSSKRLSISFFAQDNKKKSTKEEDEHIQRLLQRGIKIGHLLEENQAQAQHAPSQEDKNKKRFSLFPRKKAAELEAVTSALAEAESQAASQNMPDNRTSMNAAIEQDISDILASSNSSFEVQKSSFQTLITLLSNAAEVNPSATGRGNGLLCSYVHYIFDNIIMTATPVCNVLIELWAQILETEKIDLKASAAPDGRRKSFAKMRSRSNEMPALNVRESLRFLRGVQGGSAVDNATVGSSLCYQSLEFAWFIFDIIIKSVQLLVKNQSSTDRTEDLYTTAWKYNEVQLLSLVKELLKALSDKVMILAHDFTTFELAKSVNTDIAYFMRDLFTVMKPIYVIELLEYWIQVLNKKSTDATLKLKIEFVRTFADYEHFIPLNNPRAYTNIHGDTDNFLCVPPVRLVVDVAMEALHSTDDETRDNGVGVLKYMLTKHDSDIRYSSNDKQIAKICRMYFPYVLQLMDDLITLNKLKAIDAQDYLLCASYILYNVDKAFLSQWIKEHMETPQGTVDIVNMVKLLALCAQTLTNTINMNPATDSERHSGEQKKRLSAGAMPTSNIDQQAAADPRRGSATNRGNQLPYWVLRLKNTIGVTEYLFNYIIQEVMRHPKARQHAHRADTMLKKQYKSADIAPAILLSSSIPSEESSILEASAVYLINAMAFFNQRMKRNLKIERKDKRDMSAEPEALAFLANTVAPFLSTFKQELTADKEDTCWRWLYGTLVSFQEFPLAYTVPTADATQESMATIMAFNKEVQNCTNILEEPFAEILFTTTDTVKFSLEPDSEENLLLDAGTEQIRGASLDKLIERFTFSDRDTNLRETFFLTYRSFTKPSILLEKLVLRFGMRLPEEMANEDIYKDKVAIRVLNSIKHWIEKHFYDFNNALIIRLMRFLDTEVSTKSNNKLANQLKRLVEKRLLGVQDSTSVHIDETPKPVLPKHFVAVVRSIVLNQNRVSSLASSAGGAAAQAGTTDSTASSSSTSSSSPYTFESFMDSLLVWHPLELARQFTLIEYESFKQIKPKECFKGWNNPEISPNIVALVSRFNSLSAWIATSIVRETDLKKRGRVMKFWIKVAKELRDLNNFNGVNCIVSALNNAAVHRLHRTWETISATKMEIFNTLNAIVSTEGNYKRLREEYIRCPPPCIPYIGMWLTDLTFIADGNKDTVGPNNLINFSKRRYFAKVMMDMRVLQQSPYQFERVPALLKFISTEVLIKQSWSDDKLYEASIAIEPRK